MINPMKKIIVMLGLLMALPAVGQIHPAHRNEKPVTVITNDTDTASASKYLQENAPHSYNLPSLPRFAIFGKEGKFYLGIGGQVKATVGWDFGDVIDNPNTFTTSAIPMNPDPGNGAKFQISGQQTGMFVNFVALPGNENQIGAYLSFNLIDDNYYPNLQNAYLTWRGLKAGFGFSLFTDVAAVPPTIDYEGPNAATAIPTTILNYEHSFGKENKWKAGVGLELPQNSYTTTEFTKTVNQRVPDIPMYLQYSWDENSGWLRFSGIIRNLIYRDLVSGKNKNKIGWGVKMSGYTPVVGGLSAYYQAVFGKGVASYIQDLNGLNLDLIPNASNEAVLDPVKVWGAYVGLQYQFSPKVMATATYSHVRTYAEKYHSGSTPWMQQYRYGQYLVGNVFYNVNSILSTGIEYIWGRRVDMSGNQHHDNRIQAMIQVAF